MNEAAEVTFETENPETAPGSSSDTATEVVDFSGNILEVMPDIQSKFVENKTGNAKLKIRKTNELTAASVPGRKNLKRKPDQSPTSEMEMDSIKALKQRNGATFLDLRKYMEEQNAVNMKRLKYRADKFLQKSVDDGELEKIDRGGAEEKFKIKKSEKIKKDPKNLLRKEEKVKPKKKMPTAKKTS